MSSLKCLVVPTVLVLGLAIAGQAQTVTGPRAPPRRRTGPHYSAKEAR